MNQSNSKSGGGREESRALQAILCNGAPSLTASQFFDSVYQQGCALFIANKAAGDTMDSSTTQGNPYDDLITNGWDALIQLLQASRQEHERQGQIPALQDKEDDNDSHEYHHEAVFFRDQASLGPETSERFQNSLFAAYLDGCSVVLNHADTLSPHLAALCQDLQKSFPHAYANTYLTPPNTQSVPAHADDRDVLVVQILGQKEWTVYKNIPIPFPYPQEQVGKHLPVPDSVLEGPVLLQHVLQPGDVLYMPRGYVHHAKALSGDFSFHATIALATHDWSTAGIVTSAMEQLLHSMVDYRKAIDRQFGTTDWNRIPDTSKLQLQSSLDNAWTMLREQVTAESVHQTLQHKYSNHNERARPRREAVMAQLHDDTVHRNVVPNPPVGRLAADTVRLTTRIRVATNDEKMLIPASSRPPGLQVSEECFDVLMQVVALMKGNTSLVCRVDQLKSLCSQSTVHADLKAETVCDLTWLAFARQCVELGAFSVVGHDEG